MIKEKRHYNETHPELREGEVFLFNGVSGTYDPLKWDTKRMGAVAYTSRRVVLPRYRPIFAQRKEYEKKLNKNARKEKDEEKKERKKKKMIDAIINPIIVPMASYSETLISEQIITPYKEATRAEQEGETQ